MRRNIEKNKKGDGKNRSLFVYFSSMENIAIHLKYDRVNGRRHGCSRIFGGNGLSGGEPDHNVRIGCDILGWDIGGFHSFLCNSLQKEFPEAVFNDIGLLRNDFQEIMEFADRIEGKGEPVEWIPCRVGEIGKYGNIKVYE